MSGVRHLAVLPSGGLCGTTARVLWSTPWITDVTCTRCIKRLAAAEVAAEDRAYQSRREVSVRAVGMGHIWDHLSANDTPTGRMVLDIVGSLATYLQESGYTVATVDPAEEAA